MTGPNMERCPRQPGGTADTEHCSGSGKTATEVLKLMAEQLMLLSKLDVEEQLHVVASQLWRQLFETLSLIGVTDAEFRNMLLTSGPALSLSLRNSVKKVSNVLEAPLQWGISRNNQYSLMMDVSKFSFLGSLGAAIVCMRSGRALGSGQDNRAPLLGEREEARLKITKGTSLGIGLVAAAGTLWCAFRRYLDDNRVYRDYHVILEQVFTALLPSDDAPTVAASLPTGQLEFAIAARCKELGLGNCSVEEALEVLADLPGVGALLKECTLRDILLRANILEKVGQLRCLLKSYSSVLTGPGDIPLVKNVLGSHGAGTGAVVTETTETCDYLK